MSEYNAKNYTEQGGDVTHIGGKLIIEEGASVEGLLSTPAGNQTASEATTVAALKEDFNGLLTKLKTAGIMEADAEPDPEPAPDPEQESTTDPE